MKNYILFDLDGTLTDSAEGIIKSVQYALSFFGMEENDPVVLNSFIGPPLDESFMNTYGVSFEKAREMVMRFRERYVRIGQFENRPYDGIAEALFALKQAGKKLAVATSKMDTQAFTILEHFKLAEYFDVIVGRNEENGCLQKWDVIREVIRRFDVEDKKEQILMVGDRRNDAQGAAKCGIACMGVLYGFGSREELVEAGCQYLAESVSDLKEQILEGLI